MFRVVCLDFREKIAERLDQVLAALRRVLQGIKVLSLYSRLTVTEQLKA